MSDNKHLLLKRPGKSFKIIGLVFAVLYMGGGFVLYIIYFSVSEAYKAGSIRDVIWFSSIVGVAAFLIGRYKGRKRGYYRGLNEGFISGWRHRDDGLPLLEGEYVPYGSIGGPRNGW